MLTREQAEKLAALLKKRFPNLTAEETVKLMYDIADILL